LRVAVVLQGLVPPASGRGLHFARRRSQ
jgi:hypothetical protein